MLNAMKKHRESKNGRLVGCAHGAGTLLPYNGNWVSAVEGDETTRLLYCFECGDVFEVERRNISVEKVGNLNEERTVEEGD